MASDDALIVFHRPRNPSGAIFGNDRWSATGSNIFWRTSASAHIFSVESRPAAFECALDLEGQNARACGWHAAHASSARIHLADLRFPY